MPHEVLEPNELARLLGLLPSCQRIARRWIIAPVLCPADLDGGGVVGAADLAQLLGSWGPCPGCAADFNGDGAVGAVDLAELLGNWGACPE